MIKIVKGNLLYAKENFICHQVNCRGKMGSGVALQIRSMFPEVYENYMEEVAYHIEVDEKGNIIKDLRHTLLGKVQSVEVEHKKWILNLFGQNTYGYDGKMYTDTNALFECFKQIRN